MWVNLWIVYNVAYECVGWNSEKTPLKDDEEEAKSKEERAAEVDHASLTLNK